MDIKKAKGQFTHQKSASKSRFDKNGDSILWKLTFEEWITIWFNSGQYENRGTRRGNYVMSRKGDIGPYSIDNVDIKLHEENAREGQVGRTKIISQDQKDKISKTLTGHRPNLAIREKLSNAAKERWKRYREENH